MVKYKMLLGNIHTKLMIVIVTDGGYFQKGMGIWLNENAFCHAAELLGNISFQRHRVKCNDIAPFPSRSDLGKTKRRKRQEQEVISLCLLNFHVQVSLLKGSIKESEIS